MIIHGTIGSLISFLLVYVFSKTRYGAKLLLNESVRYWYSNTESGQAAKDIGNTYGHIAKTGFFLMLPGSLVIPAVVSLPHMMHQVLILDKTNPTPPESALYLMPDLLLWGMIIYLTGLFI